MICDGSFFARCTCHNRSVCNTDPLACVSLLEVVPPSCSHPSISSGDVIIGSVWSSSSSDPLSKSLSVQLFHELRLDFCYLVNPQWLLFYMERKCLSEDVQDVNAMTPVSLFHKTRMFGLFGGLMIIQSSARTRLMLSACCIFPLVAISSSEHVV